MQAVEPGIGGMPSTSQYGGALGKRFAVLAQLRIVSSAKMASSWIDPVDRSNRFHSAQEVFMSSSRSLAGMLVLLLAARGVLAQAQTAKADRAATDATVTTGLEAIASKGIDTAVSKGIDYLLTKGQSADGSYSSRAGGAITALAVTAILNNGRSPDDPQVAKSLKLIEGFVRQDGGIFSQGSRIPNYETCVCLVALAAANKGGRYDKIIANAEKFAKGLQWDQEEGIERASVNYGGVGYGKDSRPDLSNTAFLLEALEAAGDKGTDEAVQKAILFVTRCQNLESEDNNTKFAAKDPDGGFFYTPAAGGSSPAGQTDAGALRSYGSMTYAGLKSLLFAGVKADDPRVKAALEWLAKHYTLSENPGMGQNGVYYYYHLMAKSLDALGQPTFKDSSGKEHNWREELAAELIKRQRPDGSWVNDSRQWMEGDPNLCASFALLTLAYCRPQK
jgi:squalene-hopene/tetraprenyl-beta-curcumene cyclase